MSCEDRIPLSLLTSFVCDPLERLAANLLLPFERLSAFDFELFSLIFLKE